MTTYESAVDLFNAYQQGDRPKLHFAWHSLSRGIDMQDQANLDPTEIRAAMTEPTRILWSTKYQGIDLTYGRCTLSVGVNEFGAPVVKTILWATKEDWRRAYAGGTDAGRERRF